MEEPICEDPFFDVYDRDDPAYGLQPSAELAAYLRQSRPTGEALDLGAGAGRDTLALASAGMNVLAVDRSERGLRLLSERAAKLGISERVRTAAGDVRQLSIPEARYQVITATTVLDHIPQADARKLWQRLLAGLTPDGALYAEVHTTDDPGSATGHGATSTAPVSETARHVVNYFSPNQLLNWAIQEPGLRILRYEERSEWDYTHGPEHFHGKAILLVSKHESIDHWFGHPLAFPRQSPQMSE